MNPRLQLLFTFVGAWLCVAASATEKLNQSRHVVVVVWDGMRPDFVSEQNTPTLWKLAREGVIFRNHHSVYPSATMVNGTALVTGMYPGKNGIIANHAYRPEIDIHHSIDVELSNAVTKGDQVSLGKYIAVPTIAELVQRTGGRTAITAAKTVGLLLDRQTANVSSDFNAAASPFAEGERMKMRGARRITLFAGKSLPLDVFGLVSETLGRFPSAHLQQDTWTTKALTDVLWKDGVPPVSILWLGEPDLTQHESAPGSPTALSAIKSADENLSSVVAALGQQKTRETTDLFIVSDHGFSTIERSVDLRKILNDAGFAAKTEFETDPKPGDIMLAGNGGSVLFYVIGHDEKLIRRLVEFLQQSDFAGVIFTTKPMEGTFGLDAAMIQNEHAPDVVMAFRWNDSKNQFGVPGMIDADWQRAAGKGTHATLSRFDMHNTLIAAGPDFQHGKTDDLPTGNTDLAPTILRVLGITPPHQMDGRILSEVMNNIAPATVPPKSETKSMDAKRDFASGIWRQSLQISRVGSTTYLNEGNGTFDKR
jgi:arylsulfatase A-like enzyme